MPSCSATSSRWTTWSGERGLVARRCSACMCVCMRVVWRENARRLAAGPGAGWGCGRALHGALQDHAGLWHVGWQKQCWQGNTGAASEHSLSTAACFRPGPCFILRPLHFKTLPCLPALTTPSILSPCPPNTPPSFPASNAQGAAGKPVPVCGHPALRHRWLPAQPAAGAPARDQGELPHSPGGLTFLVKKTSKRRAHKTGPLLLRLPDFCPAIYNCSSPS